MTAPNNERPNPRPDPLAAILGPLDGGQLPGGCDKCDAYQTVRAEAGGIWRITVHHDDWCPVLSQTRRNHP